MIQDLLDHASHWTLIAVAAVFFVCLTRRRSFSRNKAMFSETDRDNH